MSETTHDPPPMLLPFVLQMLGVALAGSVLDGGYFAACYIVASGMFWIWAFRYFRRRSHPNRAAFYFFRWGPMILFWVMLFCAEPIYRLFH
jgi:hypothetical protein